MGKQDNDSIILSRNDKNYLYLKRLLQEVESKTLKVSALNYLLLNRKSAYFIYKRHKENAIFYKKQINLYDLSFSFEDMYFMKADLNFETNFQLKNSDLESLILLYEKKITPKEAIIRLSKKNKLKAIEAYNIKILNLFESSANNILLELDLNKPLEELQEYLKIAKKHYDKQKKLLEKNKLIFNNSILDEEFFNYLIAKRSSNIPFEEKIIDLLYIIDCLLINIKSKQIKLSLQDYYIENYLNLDLGYILNDYYKVLTKEAKKITPIIKKGV